MEMELRGEPCGFRISAEVGTDLMKQSQTELGRKVDRTHLRDQSRATVLEPARVTLEEASC